MASVNTGFSDRVQRLAEMVCGLWDHRDRPAPTLDDVLAAIHRETSNLPTHELVELCLIDQAFRSRVGVPARVEEYLTRLPNLAADPSAVVELAYGELRLRRDRGEQVTDDELRRRFPSGFEELRDQLELGGWWNRQAQQDDQSKHAGRSDQIDTVSLAPLDPTRFAPGMWFGSYELLELLGQGGMGIVYRARQSPFDRDVALKVIRPDRMHSEADRQRFRNEVALIARLDHPRIVPIFDVGQVGGALYFTMRLMAGGDLFRARQRVAYDHRQSAELVREIARALHHSHQRGVLHRDVKPSNILLDDGGEPQLSDFGLAARLDDYSRSLASGEILGTPTYLPPEQLSATVRPPTVAGDVYALGVVLYELLTGVPPFDNPLVIPLLESIRRGEPEPPRRRAPRLAPDLERICLKAISRSPVDRYSSAVEFADDLQRYLDGKPTRARPLSWWRRRLRWARQHPDVASLAAALLVIAVTLLTVLGVQATRLRGTRESLEQARAAARDQERRAGLVAYGAAIRASQLAWEDGDPIEFSRLLDGCQPRPGEQDDRGFEWFLLDRHLRPRVERWRLPDRDYRCVRFSPDGLTLAVGGDGQQLRLLNARDGQLSRSWALNTVVRDLSFAPDGKTLAAVGDDGCLRLCDMGDAGGAVVSWRLSEKPLRNVAFLGSSMRVATCDTDGTARVVATDTGESLAVFRDDAEFIECVAASPDGSWIATGGADGSVVIRDVATRLPLYRFSIGERKQVKCLAISRDGQRIAVGGVDRFLRVASLTRPWQHRWVWQGKHLERLYAVAFSPNGDRVGGCDKNGAAMVAWLDSTTDGDPPPRSPREHRWMAHQGRAYALAFDPLNDRIVTVGMDSHVACWSIPKAMDGVFLGDTGERARFDHSLAFTPDGMWLVVAGRSGVEIWDPRARQLNQRLETAGRVPQHVAVSPDGHWLAAGNSEDRWLQVWGRTGNEFRSVWQRDSVAANELSFSAARGTLAISDWVADRVAVFRVESGQLDREISAKQCHSVAYSPDGRSLAFTELDGSRVAGEVSRSAVEFNGHWNTVRGVCWSPSGRLLATCGEDRRVVVWDPLLGRRRCDLIGHRSQSIRGRFVDEERLLTLEEDGWLLVWHVGLGRLLCRLRPLQAGRCFDMAVAPDGQTVACQLEDGRVQILSLSRQRE